MALSTIQGVGGNISLPSGFNGKHKQWSATLDLHAVDPTGFADNGYYTSEVTYASMNGSCQSQAQFDAASSAPIPSALLASTLAPSNAKAAMTLTHTTGCTHAFTGVISSVQFDRVFDGPDNITYTFNSSGVITQTWDEA